jgi:serine/threonine protein kinase
VSPRRNEHEFAKIVDYGLVKHVEATEMAGTAITAINSIFGTPLYMSPEAILTPDAVDARSDLYALGAVAWFLLVGRPPFAGATIVEVCIQQVHATADRPSEALGRSVPADLEEIVLACLEKKPEARPQDARALRSRLETCSVSGQWTSRDAADFWRRRHSKASASDPSPQAPHTMTLDIAGREPPADVSATEAAR